MAGVLTGLCQFLHPSFERKLIMNAVAVENLTAGALETVPVVSVVDEDIAMREALGRLIRCAGWRPRMFGSAGEFLDEPRHSGPGCVIVDVRLPDLSGLELQTLIVDRAEMPVIFVAGGSDVRTIVRAMKAGAHEFMTKPFQKDVMLTAIASAIEYSRVALASESERHVLRARYATLTHRERQVMDLVVKGRLNKLTAFKLGISEITVKAHRGKVMRKMQAQSLADLINMAASLAISYAPPPCDRVGGHAVSVRAQTIAAFA